MNDQAAGDVAFSSSGSPASGERIVCVIARDVLSLQHREPEFGQMFDIIWRKRWLVVTVTMLFAIIATVYSLLATNWYVAETVLIPVTEKPMSGLAGQLGSLSALTSLAGLDLNDEKSTAEAIGVLKSRDFARQFIQDNLLLHVLLWNDWDAHAHRWREADSQKQPDIRDAIRYFDRNVLSVKEDRKTGLVTLGIRWKDQVLAASWANMIVDRLNAQMRTRALTEGNANIAYLEKEMSSATQVTLQAAIAQLIEAELQKVMVARSTPEFAFRVIDHAEVPKRRSWPKRTIIVVLGFMAGGAISIIIALISDLFSGRVRSGLRGT